MIPVLLFFFFFSPQHVTILQVPWEQKSFSQHCCKMEKQKSFFWHCCCKVEKALESGRLCFNPGSVTYQLWLSSFLICEIDIIILIAFFFFPIFSSPSFTLSFSLTSKTSVSTFTFWSLVTFNYWVLEIGWQRLSAGGMIYRVKRAGIFWHRLGVYLHNSPSSLYLNLVTALSSCSLMMKGDKDIHIPYQFKLSPILFGLPKLFLILWIYLLINWILLIWMCHLFPMKIMADRTLHSSLDFLKILNIYIRVFILNT